MHRTVKQSSSLRGELREVFERAKLPSNPAVAAQLLDLVSNPKSTAKQFAELIQSDAALAARLLKQANSAHFGQRTPVTTIQRAITVMGLRKIRMVAVGFQLVAHLDRLAGCPFDLKTFWQHSVLRACLAREIAERFIPRYAEEAFLGGLLQDCGILLLVQIYGAKYAELNAKGNLSPTAFYATEREDFQHNHVDAISVMASEWNLPDSIATPLSDHHEPVQLEETSSDIERLCAVSYFVGSIGWTGDQAAAASEPQLREYARAELALDDEGLEACFNGAGTAYRKVAHLFGKALPEDLDVTELLAEAIDQLNRAASDRELRIRRVEEERDQFSEERATLATAVAQYRERAARDPLTGLLNRGALVDATAACIPDAIERGIAITALFLDLDNFKRLNDEFGHQTGDEVLKGVARTVQEAVSNGGFAGRYGGEEFVAVVSGLSESQARKTAQGLVDAVRKTSFPELDLPAPVTCSVGAVWGRPDANTSPAGLFGAADDLMYRAKRSGKDCCVFAAATTSTAKAQSTKGAPAIPNDFRRLAEKLNREQPKRFINARKQKRYELLTPCVLSYLISPRLELRSEDAFVRNISGGGIGLLVARALVRGDLVEVSIRQGDKPLYAAGVVAFCRHIDGAIYEVGVQLADQAKQPIFARNPAAAIEELDWFAQAVRAKYGASSQAKRSA